MRVYLCRMAFPETRGQSIATWIVDPEKLSIGCFQLGMSLYEAELKIQDNPIIQSCDIIYHEQKPFSVPIVFDLVNQGLRLEFDSVSQVLTKITATNFTSLAYSFHGLSYIILTYSSIFDFF